MAEELFDLKILDPAMGSGHFLVGAVDFVTDKLLRFLDGFGKVKRIFNVASEEGMDVRGGAGDVARAQDSAAVQSGSEAD